MSLLQVLRGENPGSSMATENSKGNPGKSKAAEGNRASRRGKQSNPGIPPEGNGPWLIVGLGNPGQKYQRTRHNIGQVAIHQLVEQMGTKLSRTRFSAQTASGRLGIGPSGLPGAQVIVAICETYMNVSGGPVNALAKYYKIDPRSRLLIIHDELDLQPGMLRLKYGGSEAGHNGLKSVSQATGGRNYARLRIGVGRPSNSHQDIADYVLQPLTGTAWTELELAAQQAVRAVEDLVNSDFLSAQQRLHTR